MTVNGNSTGEDDWLVSVDNVEKKYGEQLVLRDVSLRMRAGKVVVLIGRSGSGKSTLLRCINGLESFSSGSIVVDSISVTHKSVKDGRLRQVVGMIFQQFNLFPHLTALDNITLGPRKIHRVPREQADKEALALLELVGLAERKKSYPNQMSGGEQQRVAIARALAMKPKALLFDEPTSSLDPETIGSVLAVIEELAREGMSMIIVTHEIGFARKIADHVMFLDGGVVVEEGPPEEVLDNPRTERARAFLASVL